MCVVNFIIKLTSPVASGFPAILNATEVRSQLTIKWMTMAEGVGNVFQTAIDNMKLALQQLEGAYVSFYFMSFLSLFIYKGRYYLYGERVISN